MNCNERERYIGHNSGQQKYKSSNIFLPEATIFILYPDA